MSSVIESLSQEEIDLVLAHRAAKASAKPSAPQPMSRARGVLVLTLLWLALLLIVLMGTCLIQAKNYRDNYGYTSTEPVPAPLAWLDYLIKR
jgi:hypothetical protein